MNAIPCCAWLTSTRPTRRARLQQRRLAHRIAGFPTADQFTVQDRVNAIALAPAEDFRRDSDLFGKGVRNPEAQKQIQAAMKRGFQTRDAEMALTRMLGDLAYH